MSEWQLAQERGDALSKQKKNTNKSWTAAMRDTLYNWSTLTLQKKQAKTCIEPMSVTSMLIILRWPGRILHFSENSLDATAPVGHEIARSRWAE